MDQKALVDLIVDAVDGYRLSMKGPGEALGRETPLFGPSGVLDSLGLVSVLVELEQRISEVSGHTVTLMDDRAMSQASSPGRRAGLA